MSRQYASELELLATTYEWARNVDVSELRRSINALRGGSLLVVGSGGSLSACTFVARLHETHARLPAKALTPLEFIRYPLPQTAGVVLLSAGGSNPDTRAIADHAITGEYSPFISVCARVGTPLKDRLASHPHATVYEFEGPSPKDGFLATNSLISTCVLLARAYGVELPEKLPALEDTWETLALREKLTRPYLLALADGWALAAAIDLESKWAESGFGSVVVTDARNFAHGRHHGLARQLDSTLVIGLDVNSDTEPPTPGYDLEKKEATKTDVLESTLSHLPKSATVIVLRSPLAAEAGAIDLLARVMCVVCEVGSALEFDPGRPNVPAFGRTLYRAGVPRRLLRTAQHDGTAVAEDIWIRRKVTPVVWADAAEDVRESWRDCCRSWVSTIEEARIGGIVLDYDGTLCEAGDRFGNPAKIIGEALTTLLDSGMIVGIATGRGDSVIEALRAVMKERVWPSTIVGMYNGGVCIRLNEDVPIHAGEESLDESVEHAYELLSKSPILAHITRFRSKPTQLSIHLIRPLPEGLLCRIVLEALGATGTPPAVQVVSSGHSVDVLPRNISKTLVVQEVTQVLTSAGRTDLAVMTIGDQGQAGGNDAAFLAHPLGLSVEHVSSNLAGCWNVSPRGVRRTIATLGYLNALHMRSGGVFRWSVMKASKPLRGTFRREKMIPASRIGQKGKTDEKS